MEFKFEYPTAWILLYEYIGSKLLDNEMHTTIILFSNPTQVIWTHELCLTTLSYVGSYN